MCNRSSMIFRKAAGLIMAGVLVLTIITPDFTAAAVRRGPVKYKGGLYFFNAKGKPAASKKERILSFNGNSYYVLKNGSIKKGWNVLGNDLYCFDGKNGAMLRNTTQHGITFMPDGKAQKTGKNSKGKTIRSLDVSIRIKCIKVLKKRGVFNKSRKTQLRSAWNYLTNRRTFHYKRKYPRLSDPQWTKKYADYMLSKHRGNCYGFACTFSAFAWTIGYNPYVVAGRCPGGRDGARDGYTRHCILKINGRYYDPEYWAIYRSHYLYGARHTSYSFKNRRKAVCFNKVNGSVVPEVKEISGDIKLISGNYYYFNKKGKARKGVFYIDGRLYNFYKKGRYGNCMPASETKKYQKAIKKGTPYAKLKKLIGKANRRERECDAIFSTTFFYPHILVNVKENKKGVKVIRQVIDRRSQEL